MALTKETIVAQESLANLSEEQINAIATLSQNSEDELFRQKMGEHYRRLDESIQEHSGVPRNGDEKTYDYLPRAIDAMKQEYEKNMKTLKDENAQLKSSGSADAALQAKYENVVKELNTAKKEYTSLKEEFDKAKSDNAKALTDYKIDNELTRALEGIEFKSGVNAELLATVKERALSSVKAKNPTFEERGGEQRLVFHEGEEPLLNRENQLQPFTAKELLLKEFEKYDILQTNKAKGAGAQPNKPKPTSSLGAETQVQALESIEKTVGEMGFEKGTTDFQTEVNRLWVENNCSSLPLK